MIYLDNAATTFPKPESVYVAMDKMNREGAVNAGRGSYKLAREAGRLIDDTKSKIRRLVHLDSSAAVVFSPSITIAINQIVNGMKIPDGAVVYVSPYEHNAVARSVHSLASRKNIRIKEIPLDENLEIDLDGLKYEFSKDKPSAVFCTHVSNVTGYILPIERVFEEAKRYDCITVLDSAQSMGLIDIRADLISADLIAFAGHKTLYGPFGIGGFINVSGVDLDAYITGGTGSDSLNLEMPSGKESKYESASTNIIAVAGLNAALDEVNLSECLENERQLTEYLVNKIMKIKHVKAFVPYEKSNHIAIVSFVVEGLKSDDVGLILEEDYDVAVRTGYHCAPFIHRYLNDMSSLGTIRASVGRFSTKEEIDTLVAALEEIVDE